MLDNPAMLSQALAVFYASARDPRRDAALAAFAAAAAVIVGFVGMQLTSAPPRAATPARAHGRDGVQRRREHDAVVAVGPA